MSGTSLSKVLNFDESDLAANRNGRLTEKQTGALTEKYKSNRTLYSAIGVLIIVMFCGSFLARLIPSLLNGLGGNAAQNGGVNPQQFLMTSLPVLGIAGFFVLVFGVIIVLVLRVVFGKARRQADTAVRRAEGKVNFVWVEREERNTSKAGPMFRTVRSLEMRVGADNTFKNVNSELPSVIGQDEEWVFYYTNHPFKILSAEKR